VTLRRHISEKDSKRIIMTSLEDDEEKLLDNNKTISITRGHMTFIIKPNDIVAYGEIDFENGSEDLDYIYTLNFYKNNMLSGVIVPSEYDYKTHTVTSDIKGGRRFDTTQTDIVCQYAHGCLGKPKRTIIFKSDEDSRIRKQ
jgi:hypothetical protein